MGTHDTPLSLMTKQAETIISNVKEPVGAPGWWSREHLVSMIAAITAVFGIDVEEAAVRAIVNAADNIGTSRYRVCIKVMGMLNPGQVALINGVLFPEAARQRTRALGFACIELCKAVKRGELSTGELASDKGLRLLRTEMKRQLKEPPLP